MKRSRIIILALTFAVVATAAFAQGNPTGTITGRVTDPDNLALPGVTVTAAAPVLQGVRTVVTSGNGDYIIPFLPAGDYAVTFEMQGFATVKQIVSLKMAERLPVNVKLPLAAVTEVVNVEAAATETSLTRTVATTIKAETVEVIPLGRGLDAATLLAPTTNDNGPNGAIMIAGALSYDNLTLVNGVNINDTQRQQARTLFVEDAIQETKVSSGNISAEYGRFQGGVVNMITKSGGNAFSGSFRTTFTNDAWKALTPYPGDANIDDVVPGYELTFGGPILRDKIWFFSAGRFQKNPTNVTAPYTGFNYTKTVDDKRGEGKLTWAMNTKNTVKVSYLAKSLDTENDSFSTIMDAASLYHSNVAESLFAANYQSVLTNNLFIEAQYSQRIMDTTGVGSSYMDLLKGTPIWDRSRGQARFSAPTYCAVCPNAVNLLNNYDGYAKLNYFLSTKSLGTHNIVAGFDSFKEMRKNNQNSSASSYRVQATTTIIDGLNIYPVFRTGTSTYIEWLPVFEETQGSDMRTYSGFFNDVWRLNQRLTLNLGVRYDQNSARDQGGEPVSNASTWSPRLGLTYDLGGDGRWVTNVGYAHYVGLFVTQIVDAASSAGRQASYSFYYQGPSLNDGAAPYLNSYDALQQLFNWFNANGGTSRPTRSQPTIPGVNTAVDPGIMSASTDEFMAGLAHELGNKGTVRVDLLYRKYGQIYGNFLDMSTGVATDPRTGQKFNLTIVNNTDTVERDYKGLSVQASYRGVKRLLLSGNYNLSFSRGSVEGENFTDVVVRASANEYPEYRQPDWNYPTGYLNGDQRHKFRFWGTWDTPIPAAAGSLALGFMQRYDSGLAYDHNMSIDARPYVTNPGYITPPSTVTYYVSDRGAYRFNGTWRTDMSVSWNHKIAGTSEVFARFVINNVFNNQRVDSFNTTIISRTGDATLAAFNPFSETPVEGVNWKKGPSYGQPTSPASYQSPRDVNVSVGFRF